MKVHPEAAEAVPPISRFRFLLEALEPVRLPEYSGSAWRGILGHGLRRTVCVTRQPVCDGCLLRQTCLYSTFFESPAPSGLNGRRYDRLPHPFVLDVDPQTPRETAPGQAMRLGVTLIGTHHAQAPYLIHAMSVAGDRGVGREGGRFALVALEREPNLGQQDWQVVYQTSTGEYQQLETTPPTIPPPPAEAVKITLRTPLRVKRQGHFVGARDFLPIDLLRTLCARLALLARLQGGNPESFGWDRLKHQSEGIAMSAAELRWHEWTRFSSRQNTLMQMGGLIGDFVLHGPALATFWPTLWVGQWVHVGKGTSFGLGAYRLGSA
jgi:hypothetical protein